MHCAEARGRHTVSMHAVWPVARCVPLCKHSYQNPRWSMYRVCLSCDAKRKCFVCQSKQTKEYFGASAWMARKPTRRVCLQCQTKTRGSWKCAACHQRKPQQQFSDFIGKRPSGENGTQICNVCRAVVAQAVLRKRAAASTISRLEPLRKKLRQTQVLRETWQAIQNTEKNTPGQTMTSEKEGTHEVAIPKDMEQKPPPQKHVCVLMPFLPKICYYVNCFRTCQPPTRMWETISRAGWPSSTDAAGNALFAHMPYLWNLRPEHQRIWANPKQTQTIQWPRVPPNGMACTVTTNDQFRLACLLQLSA